MNTRRDFHLRPLNLPRDPDPVNEVTSEPILPISHSRIPSISCEAGLNSIILRSTRDAILQLGVQLRTPGS